MYLFLLHGLTFSIYKYVFFLHSFLLSSNCNIVIIAFVCVLELREILFHFSRFYPEAGPHKCTLQCSPWVYFWLASSFTLCYNGIIDVQYKQCVFVHSGCVGSIFLFINFVQVFSPLLILNLNLVVHLSVPL